MDAAKPYPKGVDDALDEVAARCVTNVWHKPGVVSTCCAITSFGVIEASAQCELRHPSLVEDYVTCAVVWTHREWQTITALCAEFEEAQQ